jgi:hypothetical protein
MGAWVYGCMGVCVCVCVCVDIDVGTRVWGLMYVALVLLLIHVVSFCFSSLHLVNL